uniref:hypothetical protein n=1 Tax=Neisseria sicca TaxID=490 RepID=UPI001C9935AB
MGNKKEKGMVEELMLGVTGKWGKWGGGKVNWGVVGKGVAWIAEEGGFKVGEKRKMMMGEWGEVGGNEGVGKEEKDRGGVGGDGGERGKRRSGG